MSFSCPRDIFNLLSELVNWRIFNNEQHRQVVLRVCPQNPKSACALNPHAHLASLKASLVFPADLPELLYNLGGSSEFWEWGLANYGSSYGESVSSSRRRDDPGRCVLGFYDYLFTK